MALRTSTRLPGQLRRLAVALVALGAIALGAGAASPAMAAPFSFALSSGQPDFGLVKAGTAVPRQFDILNSGDNDIAIDPAPLFALSAPFTVSAVSFLATTVIPKNGHVSFRVTYLEPAAGMKADQTITLVATDQTDVDKLNLPITFKATSTLIDPAHFTATTTTGATADFGTVNVGSVAANTVTLTVDGVIPLSFSNGDIALTDTAGAPLTGVTITASSFGSAGAVTNPGGTAAFELTYAPTAAGSLGGSARITGTQISADPERSIVTVMVPLMGAATAVGPTTPPATPSPTATPPVTSTATPGPATPGATGAAHPGSSTGGSGGSGGRGSGGGGLAETGLPALGLGGLAGLLAVGGIAAFVAMRIRRRAARPTEEL